MPVGITPKHFGFSVDDPSGKRVNIPTVPGMQDEEVTQTRLKPTQVSGALKEVEKLDRGENLTAGFVQRFGGRSDIVLG